MSKVFLVGYDGSDGAERALNFAVAQASTDQSEILVAHVLEWSPYSFLTPDELEERHKRRQEELIRAEKHVVAPVMSKLQDQGVAARNVIRYGHSTKTLHEIAKEENVTQIFVGRSGEGSLSERLFGTTPSTLVQVASVPVTVVP